MATIDKTADLAGPGIGDYAELEHVLPDDYTPLLTPNETQRALSAVKRHIEDGLCRELGLIRVEVPLIVDVASGVNDYLDRDGSRTPVGFHIANDRGRHPVEAEVVQAATKWKRRGSGSTRSWPPGKPCARRRSRTPPVRGGRAPRSP